LIFHITTVARWFTDSQRYATTAATSTKQFDERCGVLSDIFARVVYLCLFVGFGGLPCELLFFPGETQNVSTRFS